jgi:hypothetical protein
MEDKFLIDNAMLIRNRGLAVRSLLKEAAE